MNRHQTISPQAGRDIDAPRRARARFGIGDVVRHKLFDFRGVVYDIDPVFANSEEWYESIPKEVRPSREQPFTTCSPKTRDSSYIAYVSQQNLLADESGEPVDHPAISGLFGEYEAGKYALRPRYLH
jgi:heat shock protein HspQ